MMIQGILCLLTTDFTASKNKAIVNEVIINNLMSHNNPSFRTESKTLPPNRQTVYVIQANMQFVCIVL